LREPGSTFQVVLLDGSLPDADSASLCEQIRSLPGVHAVPILMLGPSQLAKEAAHEVEQTSGGYVAKPVSERDLAAAISQAVIHRQGVPPAEPRATASAAAMPGLPPLRILLAEDNLINQQVASRLLTKNGHSVRVANNGVQAVAAFDEERFDVILMDLQMPEMGGLHRLLP
jgi:CheY-like chemotaxis protein